MSEKSHLLEIYDTEGYEGPNPVHVTGIGVVHGPERSQYYLVKPDEEVRIEGNNVTQLAVRPHYDGDSIENAVDSICTVGIALTNPETDYTEQKTFGFLDFIFWKVGKIHPNHNQPE
jgi:hypothetical protein